MRVEHLSLQGTFLMDYRYTFTVFTPTYNRARLLGDVYASLLQQTFQDFEWLIVDDGSSDDTEQRVAQWQDEGRLHIRYFRQTNGGKHRAFNRGVKEAQGRLFLPFDSDDTCTPNALERLLFHWYTIPEGQRDGYSAVTALCADKSGKIIGSAFPQDVFDSDAIELGKYGVSGDKWGFQRTDILRRFPFPEFDGEKFITESLVWNRIAMRYRTRYVNEVLQIHEYRGDGLTANVVRIRVNSPQGTTLYYREHLAHPITLGERLRTGINYLRFALHGRQLIDSFLRPPCARALLFMLMPFSIGLYLRDRWSLLET